RIESGFSQERLDRLRQAVRVKSGPGRDYTGHGDTVRRLFNAILGRQCVKISYYSEKSSRFDSFTVAPYTLLFSGNALYLLGRSEKHGECRTFAVERIDRAEPLARSFDYPEDLDRELGLERHFGVYSGEVQDVVLRVAAGHRKRMKMKRLHPSQRFVFQKDGSALIHLKVAGKVDLFRWLLTQVDAVRLESPAEWVKEYGALLSRMAAVYR
ncbi:MAG: WYL domain-containing protein, partial [Fibrobacterota bacterium]